MKKFLPAIIPTLLLVSPALFADDVSVQSVESSITTQSTLRTTYTTYDAQSRFTPAVSGGTTTYTYDANTTTTDPGTGMGYTYDDREVTRITGPTTTYDYSGTDTGPSPTFTYDSNPTSVPDDVQPEPTGTTTYTYDGLNRSTSQVDALGRTTSYQYDSGTAGPTGVIGTDPLGNVTTTTYDPVNRVIDSVDALHTTQTLYDAEGVTEVDFTTPNTTRYTYDFHGSVVAGGGTGALTPTLYDTTTSTYVYDPGVVTTPFSASGELQAGDHYVMRYTYDYNDRTEATSAATVHVALGLTPVAPLPAPALAVVPLLVLAFAKKVVRRGKNAFGIS